MRAALKGTLVAGTIVVVACAQTGQLPLGGKYGKQKDDTAYATIYLSMVDENGDGTAECRATVAPMTIVVPKNSGNGHSKKDHIEWEVVDNCPSGVAPRQVTLTFATDPTEPESTPDDTSVTPNNKTDDPKGMRDDIKRKVKNNPPPVTNNKYPYKVSIDGATSMVRAVDPEIEYEP